MSTGLLAYSGIITKTKAMSATLLTEQDYNKIVSCSSVSEVIAFLKEHRGYRSLFKDMDMGVHRGEIEHELIHALEMMYTKIYRFSPAKKRKAVQIFFCRFEVLVIRLCLRRIIKEEQVIDLSFFEEFFQKHSKLNLEKMMNQQTIEGFVESLKGTDYYQVLTEVEYIEKPTLFDYQTRLDVYYYERIWKMKDTCMSKKERSAYTDIVGRNIDILNVMWIYRFKTYFNTDNGKIMRSIIPIHYKLTKKMIAKMVAAESVAELNEIVVKSPYRKLFREEITCEEIEAAYQKYLYKVYQTQARQNPMSIIPVEYFLYLKEREIDKLTTALECVRYHLPAEKSLAILAKL